jgi:molecular chaperone GrpE
MNRMSKSKQNERSESQDKSAEDTKAAAAAEAGAPAAAAAEGEQDQVANEISSLNDQILRLRADFDNLRRRTRKEQLESGEKTRVEMIRKLLPVLDHFELGLDAARAEAAVPAGILKGFQMVQDQLRGILSESGVSEIEAMDQPFDPQLHECIAHLPSEAAPEGTVTALTRRGYRMGGAVLRPAQVVVSSGRSAGSSGEPGPAEEAGKLDG